MAINKNEMIHLFSFTYFTCMAYEKGKRSVSKYYSICLYVNNFVNIHYPPLIDLYKFKFIYIINI